MQPTASYVAASIFFDKVQPLQTLSRVTVRAAHRTTRCLLLFLLYLSARTPVAANTVEIVSVHPRYLDARNFQRIGEFFGGVERPGQRLMVRTDPESRSGTYFVITLNSRLTTLSASSAIRIEVISSGFHNPRVFRMPLPPDRPSTREVFAGITGEDWADPEERILAWRVTVEDGNGTALARKESFLWEHPNDIRLNSGD